MSYQRGSLKQFARKGGQTWVLRYRVTKPDGKRVEHGVPVGLVRDFPKEKDAWREVDKLGLLVRPRGALSKNRFRGRRSPPEVTKHQTHHRAYRSRLSLQTLGWRNC
jgi:hypothetical protein